MDVLYYLNEFPKISETFVLNELYELSARGHDVSVVAITDTDETVDHAEFRDLDVEVGYVGYPDVSFVSELFSLGSRYGFATASRVPGLKPKVGTAYLATRAVETVAAMDCEVDHVHGHFLDWYKFGARAVADYFDSPCTVTAHAYGLFRSPDSSLLSALLGSLDRVVTVSEYNRRYIEETLTTTTPVDVVHAGIRPAKFTPRGDEVEGRLLTVARLVEKKGVEDAVRAVARLVERVPTVEYNVVGSGPLRDDLEELVAALDLDDHVNLLGSVTDERLIAELDAAQAFVLPCVVASDGDRDGIPVALMEAMAMEVPPVSTRVSGIPELVSHGDNGVLVDSRAPAQLADAIERLLRDDGYRRRLARAGRSTVEQEFDIGTQIRRLETSFEVAQVARDRPGGA